MSEELVTEFWGKTKCPNCNSLNWYYMGRSDADGTGQDFEGWKCWMCKHIHLFPLATEFHPDLIPEEAYYTEGESIGWR